MQDKFENDDPLFEEWMSLSQIRARADVQRRGCRLLIDVANVSVISPDDYPVDPEEDEAQELLEDSLDELDAAIASLKRVKSASRFMAVYRGHSPKVQDKLKLMFIEGSSSAVRHVQLVESYVGRNPFQTREISLIPKSMVKPLFARVLNVGSASNHDRRLFRHRFFLPDPMRLCASNSTTMPAGAYGRLGPYAVSIDLERILADPENPVAAATFYPGSGCYRHYRDPTIIHPNIRHGVYNNGDVFRTEFQGHLRRCIQDYTIDPGTISSLLDAAYCMSNAFLRSPRVLSYLTAEQWRHVRCVTCSNLYRPGWGNLGLFTDPDLKEPQRCSSCAVLCPDCKQYGTKDRDYPHLCLDCAAEQKEEYGVPWSGELQCQ